MTKKLPLILAVIGGLLLGGMAVYLFKDGFGSIGAQQVADASDGANSDANAAVAAAGTDAKDRAATEAIVRAYLLENPEIIPEAIELLQQRQVAGRLEEASDGLESPFPGAEAGNPSGDVTVVKFTDYNCGYCRASSAEVAKLIANDKNVRVVYRELPILAETSKTAALWALAAAKQGKFVQFHTALFGAGRVSEQSIQATAQQVGLDMAAAREVISSQAAVKELQKNQNRMQELGFNGTPTFVIGNQLMEGLQEYSSLQEAVDEAREG